ncbi:MAG: dTDP-4-dehydrorhamnose 3,5-epimerase [Parcubacteria group bacterium Gr01-1014_20]|nr:MAG: dTDP-4-dehydrorhamnose 3,5-epimerase [Parcubacteria group bacterium Gr01-1014_20]
MRMEISKTKLEGVITIKPEVFEDFRGHYVQTYSKNLYAETGINVDFVQDDISVSSKHVLRGIHGDTETWKLISCLYGRFYFVVVNCDGTSPTFGQWQSFLLSSENHLQVLVPPKHGNAHLVLSDLSIFHYKQSTYYNPEKQFTYKWNDPKLNIWWPVKNPIVSQRDEQGKYL